jgi:hypothetical protein
MRKTMVFRDRRGVSVMVSYVLLISIAIIMGITIFGWLKLVANVEPVVSCEDGTSLTIEEIDCINSGEGKLLNLKIKNNGRFSVHGFFVSVGSEANEVPTVSIIPISPSSSIPPIAGKYVFASALKPDESVDTLFSDQYKDSVGVNNIDFLINRVGIQPFILVDGNEVACENAVVRQDVESCDIQ